MRYLLFSAALIAANLTAGQNLDSRIDRLEEQMKNLRVETMNGNFGAKTASAYPLLRTYGAFASIEGLYMKLSEGGTDYAFEETTNSSSTTSYNGRIKYLDFDWRFAFRVAAGYQFENPDWDVWAEYLRFSTDQGKSTKKPSNGSVLSNIYEISNIQTAKIKMDVDLNVIDLNFGRLFFTGKNFSMHPFAGFRGSIFNQKQDTPIILSNVLGLQQKNNNWGFGIRSGSQLRWYVSRNWSLFGSAAASLMYTKFHNNAFLYAVTGGVVQSRFKIDDGLRKLLPNTSIDAGISWEMAFANDRSRVRVSAGYEFDYWWRQNQMIHFKASTMAGSYSRWSEDLALQGVKLNAAFDF